MKIHGPAELVEYPNAALQMLKKGNERFAKGALTDKGGYAARREASGGGQKSFTAAAACAGARAAPKIYFDQKPGNAFIVRMPVT